MTRLAPAADEGDAHLEIVEPSRAAAGVPAVLRALRKIRGPQTQRNREFWLLLFACAISGAALTLVQLGALGVIDPMILAIGGGLAAVLVARADRAVR